jgi:ABC-type branched-subunit amino acid transport system substrate-binding protein
MKKFVGLMAGLLVVSSLSGCGGGGGSKKIVVQGITADKVLVGNAAGTSGDLAPIGIPFNQGIEAYLKKTNDANLAALGGRKIEFKTHNDEGSADKGLTYTKQLVEEEKIFALVGHFGTPTVGATLPYIQEVGVPMVYAATGINSLYFQEAKGNPVLAVQPIYRTDGRVMTARALHEPVFSGAKLPAAAKVGVIHSSTEDGLSIKDGIVDEWTFSGRPAANLVVKQIDAKDVTTISTAVAALKAADVKAVIVASNQPPFKATINALQSGSLLVPVFTSYVNADATAVDVAVNYGFDIYANAWVDTGKNAGADLTTFMADISAYDPTNTFVGIAYQIAGYIAAKIFVEGLVAASEDAGGLDKVTWASFITSMENHGEFQVPLGGTVSYTGGRRWGIAAMSLLKLTWVPATETTPAAWAWAANLPIEDLAQIEAK